MGVSVEVRNSPLIIIIDPDGIRHLLLTPLYNPFLAIMKPDRDQQAERVA
jgi:hypothetical protein